MTVPARVVLQQAETLNAALGHVNLGALSEAHGFVSADQPVVDLPAPFNVWTAAAAALPYLCDRLIVRRTLDKLPLLDASPDALPDKYLMRASSVLGLLAHAYGNIEVLASERLPDAIVKPWSVLAWRLDKPRWTLTTTDYMWHNWRLIDPLAPRPMRVENMKVLTSIWNNPSIEVFMLMVLEFLAQSAPLVGSVVRAQEAISEHNDAALKVEFALMTDVFRSLALETLLKANPNRHCGAFYVDPVIWTKTFAALPAALRTGIHNATGVETPSFHMIDEFLERRDYKTKLGGEALTLRSAFPQHWKQFLVAIREVSVVDYVEKSSDPELRGLFREMLEAYQGPEGLLARHRLKAFTFLDAAFKTGHALDRRRSQVSGFSGMFKDRSWDLVDTSFEDARVEREEQYPTQVSFARISKVTAAGPASHSVRRIVFDVKGLGMRYAPGDRLAVLAENPPVLVARTLAALDARGDEEIALDRRWRATISTRADYAATQKMRLSELLKFGQLRPITRDIAKRLYAVSHSEFLRYVLNRRMEDQWELWDLLEQLKAGGFEPKRIVAALAGEPHHMCQIVPPMSLRLYSISSAPQSVKAPADEIELTVGPLVYETLAAEAGSRVRRHGTASTFMCDFRSESKGTVAIRVIRPPRFSLPLNSSVPIIMFAAGTGIAPFRGFLQARARSPSGRTVLVYSVRDVDSILYRQEMEELQAAGKLELHVAVSRESVRPIFDEGSKKLKMVPGEPCRVDTLARDPVIARRLRQLVLSPEDGGEGAFVYVCGRATFASSVLEVLVELLGQGATPEQAREDGYRAVYRMIGNDRYMQDVFTTYTGAANSKTRHVDISELMLRNRADGELWQAIDGRVYDLTRFAQMHPGGAKLIQSYAGMDATDAYRKVEHHRNPEVDSMLAMFEVGVMRRLDFGMEWTVTAGEDGLQFMLLSTVFRLWVRFVYLFVEIENAYHMETSIKDEVLVSSLSSENTRNSPFKLQFQIEAHHRFVNETINYLCNETAKLWSRTAGALAPTIDIRWLEGEFGKLRGSPDAKEAMRWTDELQRRNVGLSGPELEHWHQHVVKLQAADIAFMDKLKKGLREGLIVFETNERNTLRLGTQTLLTAFRLLPPMVRDYYTQLRQERLAAGTHRS